MVERRIINIAEKMCCGEKFVLIDHLFSPLVNSVTEAISNLFLAKVNTQT